MTLVSLSLSNFLNAFNKDERVGVCGATSTPMWLMEEVKERILEF